MSELDQLKPGSLDELSDIIASAVADGRKLELVGHATKRGLGRPVEQAHRLDLSGLNGIAMYEPEELVMSAGAGTPLAQIEAMLAERNQELAFEPADYGVVLGSEPDRQTIGGVFACNLSGPRRLKAGAARDHLLGLNCVTGHGQVIKTGGRVVKNVTGYDLCKLLTGSHGTLAALSQVTFKVLPRAEAEASIILAGPAEGVLLAGLRRAMGSAFDVSSAAMLPAAAAARSSLPAISGAGRPVAVIRLDGPPPSIRYRADRLAGLLARDGAELAQLEMEGSRVLWAEIRDVRLLPGQPTLWRLSIAPDKAIVLQDRLADFDHEKLFDWAGGLVWLSTAADDTIAARTVRTAIAELGGHATLVRARAATRARIDPFEPQPPALRALSARIKKSFDPKGTLNPGRMYEGL